MASACVQVELGGEAFRHLYGLRQLPVADHHPAVGEARGAPVAPRRTGREQVDHGHVLSVLGQQAIQALVVRGPPFARLKMLEAL